MAAERPNAVWRPGPVTSPPRRSPRAGELPTPPAWGAPKEQPPRNLSGTRTVRAGVAGKQVGCTPDLTEGETAARLDEAAARSSQVHRQRGKQHRHARRLPVTPSRTPPAPPGPTDARRARRRRRLHPPAHRPDRGRAGPDARRRRRGERRRAARRDRARVDPPRR